MGFHLEAPVQLIKVGSLVLLPAIEAGKVFLPELAPWGRRLFVIRADSAPPKLPDIPSLLSSMVSNSVASSAHRYQVIFGIIAGVAAKLFVVNFQV